MRNKVSVAMITYNSIKYIKEQIDTILVNLNKDDELVISDDGSIDGTIDFINSYIKRDNRIRLLHNVNHGINNNYINAIKSCNGDIIFLSDDDNVWMDSKVDIVLEAFNKNKKCLMVQHDCKIVDQDLNLIEESFFNYYHSKPGLIKNWIKSSYGGSLIAFRKELLKYIIPLPKHMPTYYDDWFGLMAAKHGKVIFINDKLSLWRRHSGSSSTGFISNSSKKQNRFISFFRKLRERIKVRFIKLGWILFR